MAKTKTEEEKPVEEAVPEEETQEIPEMPPTEEAIVAQIEQKKVDLEGWKPRTAVGKRVKEGSITSMDDILNQGLKILEPEITEILLPTIDSDLIMSGQAKGKFGGGQRRVFKQTQKKTNEGNKPSFSTMVVMGDKDGHMGVGVGKARETVPAREKAVRRAKLGIMRINRGCGSWECGCGKPHSIPFSVSGKCGSTIIRLFPAPQGTGLRVQKECQRLFVAAGIDDVWSRTIGQTRTTRNLITACQQAMGKLTKTKMQPDVRESLGVK